MGLAVTLSSPVTSGYQMIKTLKIQNFRGFDDLQLTDLKRFNVIVGPNGSGKTSLLEAIFLALGASPELHLILRQWRGLGERVRITPDLASHHELWSDIFYGFDEKNRPAIAFFGTEDITRTLRIFYSPATDVVIPLSDNTKETRRVSPITFQWKKGAKLLHTASATIVGTEIKITGGGGTAIPGQFFNNASSGNLIQAAEQFSDLRIARKTQPIIDVVTRMYPFIKNIEVVTYNGVGMLHADIPHLPKLVPLGLVSSGIAKIVSVLIAIAKFEKGVILVDEIENGFYYEKMGDVWKYLVEFAEVNKAQIFASTHSLEALKSLLPALKEHESKFCLLRARRDEDKIHIRQVEGKYFEAALEGGMEVR